MGSRHIVEVLVEANKNISKIIDKMQNEKSANPDRQDWIDDINEIISQLDHVVEHLEED